MTEEQMKAELDGKFFTWHYHKETICALEVPLDYIPDHRRLSIPEGEDKSYQWSASEDDTIFLMRNAGNTWRVISEEMGFAESTVAKRYLEICEMRGVEPSCVEVNAARKFSRETERAVVKMRGQGMPFRKIGEVLGITRLQANHIYIRWRNREARAA